ncbi:MAG: amidohydrolase [Cyclobacteriaceae bacterium]|nr:MAG: amidohydrolase [Cyclobacteriaceae bacterium]
MSQQVQPIKAIFLLWLFTVAATSAQEWVLQHVKVVDVQTGQLSTGTRDIYISQGRILTIAESGTSLLYSNFKVVEGNGNFVIPGLWDMHAHPDDPELWRMNPLRPDRDLLLPQFVLQGVTGIRDMAGSLEEVNHWRTAGEQGELLVPKIVACGPLLDGPNPMWDGSVGINDPSMVASVVDSLILNGSDFLKVYSLLPRETYLELAAYASQIDFPMVGHVPFDVTPSEAAATGMSSQEHLLEILKECSSRREEIISDKIDYGDLQSGIERYVFRQNLMMDSFDTTKFQLLIKEFIKYGTQVTPTLSMWYKNAWYEQEYTSDSLWLSYLPEYLRKYWTPEHNDHLKHRDNQDFIAIKQRLYRFYEYMVAEMNQAGVAILCGTDMGANPLCFPGTGVHNELKAMVEAGLSPVKALQTATINPARFLKLEEDFGTVAAGKVADLVLLDKNPLTDIENVRTVKSVVQKGVLYDEETRFRILEEIRKAVQK